MRRMMVLTICFAAAVLMCEVPRQCRAEESAKHDTETAEQNKKDETETEKGKDASENVRDGINRAYDGFKKEAAKGKQNLNELYEREKAKRN